MKINKAELVRALELVKPGLANKELIEQSTSFAFIGGNVITYNDEISLSHPIANLEVEGAIHAAEFYSFVSKIKGEELEVGFVGEQLIFKAGRSRAGFTMQAEVKLPLEEITVVNEWHDLAEDFCHYLMLAAGACGTDLTEPILSCVSVTNEGTLTGSDNQRIMVCSMESLPVQNFLLPVKAAMEVVKLKPVQIAEKQNWVQFKSADGTILSCRIYYENYPTLGEHIQVEGISLSLPSSTLEILDRAAPFYSRTYNPDEQVTIHIADNRMKVTAENEAGWFEEAANMRTTEEVKFTIRPYLLRGILEETSQFILSENAMKFQGDGWQYIAALLNVE